MSESTQAGRFKPGDRVVCVNVSGEYASRLLAEGCEDEVGAVDDTGAVCLDGMHGYWWEPSRFRHADPPAPSHCCQGPPCRGCGGPVYDDCRDGCTLSACRSARTQAAPAAAACPRCGFPGVEGGENAPATPEYQRLREENGTLRCRLRQYVVAASRMLLRWSESDDMLRNELWRNLHACEEPAREALSAEEEQRTPTDWAKLSYAKLTTDERQEFNRWFSVFDKRHYAGGEVERLRAENARLTREVADLTHEGRLREDELRRACNGIDALKAEVNAELRRAADESNG